MILPPRTVFNVLAVFLASKPSPEAILAYQLPAELEQRAADLTARDEQHELTFDEKQELRDFIYANNMLLVLKARTRQKPSV